MVTYVILGSYTEQGIRNIKHLPQVRAAAEQFVAGKSGRVVANYTTFGGYDFVFIAEFPNDEAALEGAFLFGSRGDVRTTTLRAFTPQEAEAVAKRLP
ncbi:MAG TPA: GYD domain-containing protein [bacterium]|nr:GYD domain-containing protein [bacterium]